MIDRADALFFVALIPILALIGWYRWVTFYRPMRDLIQKLTAAPYNPRVRK